MMNLVRPKAGPTLLVATVALAASLLLSSCFVLIQGEMFAVGTESNRANLVVHRTYSRSLDLDGIHGIGVARTRQMVINATPSSFRIPLAARAMACSLGVAGCVAQATLPGLVRSWWLNDVRYRGDFGEALHQARVENKCFAWTFVAISGRNFTVKPRGNSGCR